MKKVLATLLILVFIISTLTSCVLFKTKEKKVRIGYMAGPTGMGMAKLISDNGGLENGNEKYSFKKYTDTTVAKADLAAGNIDIICLPTNEAVLYYKNIDSNSRILAINCLNSLYLVGSGLQSSPEYSLADLEGQTIYTCKNGTPRIILEYILKNAGINATISYTVDGKDVLTPADLSTLVIAGKIPNAVMPEPMVTTSILKTISNSDANKIYSVKLDLGEEWNKISDTPIAMGCIVASGDFVKSSRRLIDSFLDEYKLSIEYIGNSDNLDSAATYVVETGVIGAAPAARMALKNLGNSISYIDGANMKETLTAFYESIGISLPDDDFYYEK